MAATMQALSEADTGMIVFLMIHMKGQLERIESDPKFGKLGDDAKLAHGGLVRGVEILGELYDRNKILS